MVAPNALDREGLDERRLPAPACLLVNGEHAQLV